MKRKFPALVGALSLVVAGMIGLPSTAYAAKDKCPKGKFCLYFHENFKSLLGWYDPDESTYWCNSIYGDHVGDASSMVNNTGRKVELYDYYDCKGSPGYVAKPHSKDSTFKNNGWNDKTYRFVWK